MSFCRYGDPDLPKFYIYRTFDERLNISILGEHQKLNKKQVEHLRLILVEWMIRGVLEGWLGIGDGCSALHGWHISPEMGKRGKKILSIRFPSVDVLLSLGQVLTLKKILESWINAYDEKVGDAT